MTVRDTGPLRCYNQFPRHYKNFKEMIAQLDDIAAMGFDAVWTNPLHPVSEIPKEDGNKSSIYAMTDPWKWRADFFGTDNVEQQKRLIRLYTSKAKRLGLTPMFDLVLKHLGKTPDDLYLLNKEGISPEAFSHWFVKGFSKIDGDKWDDVKSIDYHNQAVREEVENRLWKPFIKMYMDDLGFDGIRIDAAQHVYADVVKDMSRYAKERWDAKNSKTPFFALEEIVGEYDTTQMHYLTANHDGLPTHINNFAYWMPNKGDPNKDPFKRNDTGKAPRDMTPDEYRNYWTQNVGVFDGEKSEVLHVVRKTPDKKEKKAIVNGAIVGTIGHAYSHDDHRPLVARMVAHGITDGDEIAKALREKIAIAAFYSDAGWMAGTGIETGDSRSPSVFDHENNKQPPQPHCDMRPFIKEVNALIAKQPPLRVFNWTDRVFLPGKSELVIFNTHNGAEGEELGPNELRNYVKIVNTDPTKTVKLTADDIKNVAEWTGKKLSDFYKDKDNSLEARGIYMCGGVEIESLQAKIGPTRSAAVEENYATSPDSNHVAALVASSGQRII